MNAHGVSFREQRTQYAYDIRSAYGLALRIRVTWPIVFSSFLLSSFSTACYVVLSKSCRQLDAMLVNTMDQKLDCQTSISGAAQKCNVDRKMIRPWIKHKEEVVEMDE